MKRPKYRSLWIAAACGVGLVGIAGDTARHGRNPQALAKPALQRAVPGVVDPDNWKTLARALNRETKHYKGSVGYIVKDLDSGDVVTWNADRVFPSASLIKVPIMVAAYNAVHEGRISLSQTIPLRREDRRGGSGILKFAPLGSLYTNRELVELMIVHSDNTAAELLIKQLGYDYMRDSFARLGLLDTEIYPSGFKLTSRRVLEDNMTSPRDMGVLLEKIYRRELVSATASDDMMTILKNQKLRDRLPKYLPQGWEIAHKTGLLRKACHDVGIVFSPSGNYMVCVLTADQSTYKMAKRLIASVGRITFDYYRYGTADPQARHLSKSATHAG
jgi:beta-lactamase class A